MRRLIGAVIYIESKEYPQSRESRKVHLGTVFICGGKYIASSITSTNLPVMISP
jgi:hypothetical protein